MKKFFLVLSVFSFRSAIAQDSLRQNILDEVSVTASKFPVKQSLSGRATTIINRATIEKFAGSNLTELIHQQAGIFIGGSNGTPGTNQDVYVRGASSGKTLILIDGVPVYDPSGINNAFDLNLINLLQVERIEIVKGTLSTLYGSDAIAGVINIITQKNTTQRIEGTGILKAGSFGTFQGGLNVTGGTQKTNYTLGYQHYRSDGISAAYDSTHSGTFDRDGFRQNTIDARIRHQLSDQLALSVSGSYTDNQGDMDAGAFTDDRDNTFHSINRQIQAQLSWRNSLGESKFNVHYNNILRKYRDDSTHVGGYNTFAESRFIGNALFAEWYQNFILHEKFNLLAGIDYRLQLTDQESFSINDWGTSTSKINKDSADVKQFAAYLSGLWKVLPKLQIEFGTRFNSFNRYGDVWTYSFNPAYLINEQWKVFGNISSGFKAPSLYQIYSPYYNPATGLKPERSLSIEGGIAFRQNNTQVRIVYFNRDVRDNIAFFGNFYANVDRQKDHGFEVELQQNFGRFSLNAFYSYVDGEVETPTEKFFNLYRRPKHTTQVNLAHQTTAKWSNEINFRAVGKRYEPIFGSDPLPMDPYQVLNFISNYKFNQRLTAFAEFKNITDQHYFDVWGYNTKRFNFMAGILVKL